MQKDEQTRRFFEYIYGLQCWYCNCYGTEPHHLTKRKPRRSIHIGNVIPLCRKCHMFFGKYPNKERKYIKQMLEYAEKLKQNYENT